MSTPDNAELDAAKDYRAQQQEHFKTNDDRRLRLDPSQLDATVAFIKQQFPDNDLPNLREDILAGMASEVGPEDDPLSHSSLEFHTREIEQVISGLGFSLRSGVSAGILHGDSLAAMQMPVITTQASVILVTSHLTTLIYRLAKLMARTVIIQPDTDGVSQLIWHVDPVMKSMKADTELHRDWGMFFLDCCSNPKAPEIGRPIVVKGGQRIHLLADLGEAMTWFVLAHEYGHHVLGHSLEGKAQVGGETPTVARSKENEADALGAIVCMILGQNNERGPNHSAKVNAGAVLILSVLDFIKRGHQIMLTGQEEGYKKDQAHPPLAERLATIAGITRGFIEHNCPDQQDSHDAFLKQQTDIAELIDAIWRDNSSFLRYAYAKGKRGISDQQDWLPS
jgi:hypothetical protein